MHRGSAPLNPELFKGQLHKLFLKKNYIYLLAFLGLCGFAWLHDMTKWLSMQAGGQEDGAFRRTGEVEIDLFKWENRLIELDTLSKVTQTSGKTDIKS